MKRISKVRIFLGIIVLSCLAGVFIHSKYVAKGYVLKDKAWGDLLIDSSSKTSSEPSILAPKQHKYASVNDLIALLGPAELKNLKENHYTAVICMQGFQDVRNDWSRLQIKGISETFEDLGIELIAVTDGEFEIDKQIADYKNVIALKPDIIVTIPLDTEKCALVLREAVTQGIKLVFIDNVPEDFVPGKDYIGMVMADSFANGWYSGDLLARRLSGKGKVALLHWRNRMFTCDERSRAVREVLKKYPNIQVVGEEYFKGIYDVAPIMENILSKHPDLNGLWVVWDTPALEAVEKIRQLKKNVLITTVDLSEDTADEIYRNEILVGCGAQHPYQQGIAEALMAGAGLVGKKTPSLVVVPGTLVTKENLLDSWEQVFLNKIPSKIINKEKGK